MTELTQLRGYCEYLDELQGDIDLSDIVPAVQPIDRIKRGRWEARSLLVAAAAAVAILVLVGGVAWLAQQGANDVVDQPTSTTISSPPAGVRGVLGPGSWSVAAAFTDQEATPEVIGSAADVVRAWPGVLEVAEAPDSEAWLRLAGLKSNCGAGDVDPPCGSGLVVLTVDSSTSETATRLRTEFGMAAVTPIDVPGAFVDGYFDAAIDTASPVPLEFDPSSLGIEQPLSGPFVSPPTDSVADGCFCDLTVQVEVDGVVAGAGIAIFEVDVYDLLIDQLGRGGVVTDLHGVVLRRRAYQFAGLPLAAAVVTFEQADGTIVWQRPLGGMALILDAPGSGGAKEFGDEEPAIEPSLRGESEDAGPFHVLDATGTEIMRIQDTPDGPIIEDLRIAASIAADAGGSMAIAGLEITDVITTGDLENILDPIVETGDAVWVASLGSVVRIDAATREVTDRVPIPGLVVDLTSAADAVWAMSPGTVSRIDAVTRQVTDTFQVPFTDRRRRGERLKLLDDELWVSHSAGFDRIDLNTLNADTIDYLLVGDGQRDRTWLGEFDGALWLLTSNDSRQPQKLTRIDLATRHVEDHDLPSGLLRETFAILQDHSVWFVAYLDNEVAHLDLESGELTRILNLGDINGGAYADGAFWVPNRSGRVIRIDAATLEVTDTVSVGPSPAFLVAAGNGSLWISHDDHQTVSRIDTATRGLTHAVDLGTDVGRLMAFDGAIWVEGNNTVTRIRYP